MDLNEAFSLFIQDNFSKGNSKETLYYYNYNIPPFIEFCASKKIFEVEKVDSKIFDDYKSHLLLSNPNTKKITLQTYSRAVKVFINWLNDFNLVNDIGTLKLIKAETKNIVPLSDAEVEILLNSFDNSFFGIRNKLICLLMVDSGLRRGEVVTLLRDNISFINHTMLVIGKGNKERLVPFGLETQKYMKKFISISNLSDNHLLQNKYGEPITRNTIKCFFQDLKIDTGIQRLYPHLLRHTFATNYIYYGGDVESLRILLGHTSIAMTQKYVHLAAQQRILNQKYNSHIDKLLNKYDSNAVCF